MDRELTWLIVTALIICIVFSAGCIVPEKRTTVPGTPAGPTSGQGSPGGQAGSGPGTGQATPTEDTRYLSQVSPYPTQTVDLLSPQGRVLPETTLNESYFEIYNVTQSFKGNTNAYVYNLSSPILQIILNVNPNMVTDKIAYTNRSLSREFEEKVVKKPSPDAFFEMTVRDRNTGNVILKDGYGKIYGFETKKEIFIRQPGAYQFDLTGYDANVTVAMKIRQ
jgi:hypothetical protein